MIACLLCRQRYYRKKLKRRLEYLEERLQLSSDSQQRRKPKACSSPFLGDCVRVGAPGQQYLDSPNLSNPQGLARGRPRTAELVTPPSFHDFPMVPRPSLYMQSSPYYPYDNPARPFYIQDNINHSQDSLTTTSDCISAQGSINCLQFQQPSLRGPTFLDSSGSDGPIGFADIYPVAPDAGILSMTQTDQNYFWPGVGGI